VLTRQIKKAMVGAKSDETKDSGGGLLNYQKKNEQENAAGLFSAKHCGKES